MPEVDPVPVPPVCDGLALVGHEESVEDELLDLTARAECCLDLLPFWGRPGGLLPRRVDESYGAPLGESLNDLDGVERDGPDVVLLPQPRQLAQQGREVVVPALVRVPRQPGGGTLNLPL